MRYLFKTIFLLVTITLCGCDLNQSSSSKGKVIVSTSEEKQYSYDEVSDKMIFWSNIFGIDQDSYYVYLFSRTCSHCDSLKSFIIPLAIERSDIYFVEASEQVVFIEDAASTIGLTSIEGLGIVGYPSLIKIKEKSVEKNIAGTSLIKSELVN